MAKETKARTTRRRAKSAASPAAELPPTAAEFAAKAQNLEALRTAVVDAAGVGAGLWFSYLFVLLYLLIAVGSVTHRDLLLEIPIKLPFLGVELPLVGFFVLGPLLFLVAHAYVLLHFVLLAGKVDAFHTQLQTQISDPDTRTRLRRQLPSNIFVQALAGPREVRTGVLGRMLRLIAQISLVAGPVALLVFFQLQFLPYHLGWVTWWHRFAVPADLALLWVLWPSVARGATTWIGWRDLRRGKVLATAVASLVPLLLVFTIATFPGEWPHEELRPVRFVPTKWPSAPVQEAKKSNTGTQQAEKGKTPPHIALVQSMGWTSLHKLLIAGEVDEVSRKPASLWSNRLVLAYVDVVDRAKFDTEEKINAVRETLSLRGRRLEGAVLVGARLRKVDFAAARLQDAVLDGADLREAKFECAYFENCTNLQGASLDGAQLQGASLDGAQLQGTSLAFAQLAGASLNEAKLQGASLDSAQLQGASLDSAQLQGASLTDAELQGASLVDAQLQGASLNEAKLQGASLVNAQLQGASLDGAQLQGASLDDAQVQGASLRRVFVWRTNPAYLDGESARIVGPITSRHYTAPGCRGCEWRAGQFTALKRIIEEQVPKGERRDQALKQIAALDPANLNEESEKKISDSWAKLAKFSPSDSEYQNTLATVLRYTGCDAAGAPYVIRWLISQIDGRFEPGSPHPAQLAAAFLNEKLCPGARGLSEADRMRLTQIKERPSAASASPPPVPPKQ